MRQALRAGADVARTVLAAADDTVLLQVLGSGEPWDGLADRRRSRVVDELVSRGGRRLPETAEKLAHEVLRSLLYLDHAGAGLPPDRPDLVPDHPEAPPDRSGPPAAGTGRVRAGGRSRDGHPDGDGHRDGRPDRGAHRGGGARGGGGPRGTYRNPEGHRLPAGRDGERGWRPVAGPADPARPWPPEDSRIRDAVALYEGLVRPYAERGRTPELLATALPRLWNLPGGAGREVVVRIVDSPGPAGFGEPGWRALFLNLAAPGPWAPSAWDPGPWHRERDLPGRPSGQREPGGRAPYGAVRFRTAGRPEPRPGQLWVTALLAVIVTAVALIVVLALG
ncbi:hypothetical protein IHE55_22840 [Streptomyces pactum]|uniref:Uncharacterized protein n=1 Tax=Streptomyces pactum TaxID=68249 RepID=A0ABS0NQH9_9ACTN|nr:hypothetical protein [Streptomyces pactum]MBH5337443.1 hypothetical protein [Streptomyces pactum]